MNLDLSLPEIIESKDSDIEIRPGKLASWLESLPVLNLVDTSHKIHRALSATNRIKIDDKTRLKLLEAYRQPIASICDELEKDFNGNSLPLSTKALQSASRARGLQVEMAYGYKILSQSMAQSLNGKIKDKQRKHLAFTAQRAIFYLASSLYYSYISYHPAIPGVWKEIHQLYNFALQYQATDIELEDSLNVAGSKSSVSKNYKKAILLDLSGPYHLPGRSVQNVYHCLDQWSQLADLSTATTLPKDSCQFLISHDKDSAGEIYNSSSVDAAQLKDYLMLNTLKLARHVHARLKSLHSGDIPEENGIKAGMFTEESSRELLTSLVSAWGVNPKRNFRRVSRKGDTVDIALGIESINFWLNGGEALVLSSEFVGPMPQKKSRLGTLYMQGTEQSSGDATSIELENNPDLNYIEWNIIDESAGGLALATSRATHQHTKAGDIMGIRGSNGSHWEIVVVRWIKNTDAETISIGVQRLAPDAVAISINVLDESGENTAFKLALLLPALPALKQAATIAAEKSSLGHGQKFFMDNGYQMNEAKATRVIESTTAFERFEFTITQTA